MSPWSTKPRRGGTWLFKLKSYPPCVQTPPVRPAIVGDPDADDAIAAATARRQFAGPLGGTSTRQPQVSHHSLITSH